MTLGELIEFLEKQDTALLLPEGFANPHSYRGYYDELAFEPAQNVTVGSMLDAAKSALGTTYEGWKGGEYTMQAYTDCWLASRGDTGEGLGAGMLRLMIAAGRREVADERKLAIALAALREIDQAEDCNSKARSIAEDALSDIADVDL